jgi:hypothetical protein
MQNGAASGLDKHSMKHVRSEADSSFLVPSGFKASTPLMRKLHDEELRDLYSSPSMFGMIKSRRMIWARHVARMRRKGTHVAYWWEGKKERDH